MSCSTSARTASASMVRVARQPFGIDIERQRFGFGADRLGHARVLGVRSPSHGENRGSSPLGSASKISDLIALRAWSTSPCLLFVYYPRRGTKRFLWIGVHARPRTISINSPVIRESGSESFFAPTVQPRRSPTAARTRQQGREGLPPVSLHVLRRTRGNAVFRDPRDR